MTDAPIITIAMRTQGTRLEVLTEALYSVFAQTMDSYEVLLLLHTKDEDPESVRRLKSFLTTLAPALAEKIKLVPVVGGGRARPLNAALDSACGVWLCHLDDDDLLLDGHFAALRTAASDDPESNAFHTFGVLREVSVLNSERGSTFPYVPTEIKGLYYRPHSMLVQTTENGLPICNVFTKLAFIRSTGIRFDEAYDVLEDYKFWIDLSHFTIIKTIHQFTTLITQRDNHSNSATDPESAAVWNAHLQRIRAEIFSNSSMVTAQDLARMDEFRHIYREWKLTRARLGAGMVVVKLMSHAVAFVRKLTPATLRRVITRALDR